MINVPNLQGLDSLELVAQDEDGWFIQNGGAVTFEVRRSGPFLINIVRNTYVAPVTLTWELRDLVNCEVLGHHAKVGTIGPGGAAIASMMTCPDPSKRWQRNGGGAASFGDPNVTPDAYIYCLPYPVGLTPPVIQGFHGSISHQGRYEYAVDFGLPEGTPVLAARPGIVVHTKDTIAGATDDRAALDQIGSANFVTVLHDDGTLADYAHLAPRGVHVEPRQRVERGQQLGLSGNTGFSTGPHLHFQIFTAVASGVTTRSFPFEMQLAPEVIGEPLAGERYTAWEAR